MKTDNSFLKLLENLSDAIYVCGPDGSVQMYNQAAVQRWGWEPEIGRNFHHHPWDVQHYDGRRFELTGHIQHNILAKNKTLDGIRLQIVYPDGRRHPALLYSSLLHDKHGTYTGSVNMLISEAFPQN